MTVDRRQLARLLRLERVRSVARQTAASEAARAESTLAQLQALVVRSGELAAEYAERQGSMGGDDLRRLALFAGGLHAVRSGTLADASRAQGVADLRQGELAAAERRRAAAEDRAVAVARQIIVRAQAPVLGARRK